MYRVSIIKHLGSGRKLGYSLVGCYTYKQVKELRSKEE